MLRLAVALALAGCGTADRAPSPRDASASDAPVAPAPPARTADDPATAPSPRGPPTRGEVVPIPEGVVLLGSLPGTVDRDPRREVDAVAVTVPAFEIDRLPYPNDPAAPSRTNVSRDDAERACGELGKRLCTEVEWERACEGASDARYPTGDSIDLEACALDASACGSPFGVLAMGTGALEWTSSPVTRGIGSARWSAIARGGAITDPVSEHRCAARHALAPAEPERDAGFRCCRSAAPGATIPPYPEEQPRRRFRERDVPDEEIRRILASVPELARFATGFRSFDPEDVDRALARGGVTREQVLFRLVPRVLEWSPEQGELAWVLAGTDGASSFVAVVHPLGDGRFVHGASFVLAGETPSIALGWDPGLRETVQWSTAWGRTGEGGVIELRDDHRIVIVQR